MDNVKQYIGAKRHILVLKISEDSTSIHKQKSNEIYRVMYSPVYNEVMSPRHLVIDAIRGDFE